MNGEPMVKIRFRYVVEDRDERGNVRLYLRLPGRAKVRLREMPGTEAFLTEYQAAVAGYQPRSSSVRRVEAAEGSMLWLCTAYAATGEFRMLDARTQRVRRRILELCCAEPIAPGKTATMGALPVRRMPAKVITALRDRKAELPEAANARVKALRQVFAWAVTAGHADLNPARDVAYLTPAVGGALPGRRLTCSDSRLRTRSARKPASRSYCCSTPASGVQTSFGSDRKTFETAG